ncbi:MAG: hypothetical protein EXS49_01775 [Candidatus Pacebacteria bacterium]|nr:hypothetical protein [Candidatus Paceibacterota bacterium]
MNKLYTYIAILIFWGISLSLNSFAFASETNSAPVWNSIANKAGFYGEIITFNISAHDADGDELTYVMTQGPAGAYFDPARKQFAWIPKAYQLGNNSLTFTVFDGADWAYKNIIVVVSTPNPLPESLAINSGNRAVDQYDIFGIFNNSNSRKSKASASSEIFNFGSKTKSESSTEAKTKKDEAELLVSDIQVKKSGDGVIVSWKTNNASTERVIYDLDSEANKTKNFTYDYATMENSDLNKAHSIKINGLGENKTYYLRVVSKDGNKKVISNELAFAFDDNLSSAGAFTGNLDFLKNPFLYIFIVLFIGLWIYFKRRKTSPVSGISSDIPTVASLKI